MSCSSAAAIVLLVQLLKVFYVTRAQDSADYFQYVRSQSPGNYEFGYRRGNSDHLISRFEEANDGRFRTKVEWIDKDGSRGGHYWDYNHGDDEETSNYDTHNNFDVHYKSLESVNSGDGSTFPFLSSNNDVSSNPGVHSTLSLPNYYYFHPQLKYGTGLQQFDPRYAAENIYKQPTGYKVTEETDSSDDGGGVAEAGSLEYSAIRGVFDGKTQSDLSLSNDVIFQQTTVSSVTKPFHYSKPFRSYPVPAREPFRNAISAAEDMTEHIGSRPSFHDTKNKSSSPLLFVTPPSSRKRNVATIDAHRNRLSTRPHQPAATKHTLSAKPALYSNRQKGTRYAPGYQRYPFISGYLRYRPHGFQKQ